MTGLEYLNQRIKDRACATEFWGQYLILGNPPEFLLSPLPQGGIKKCPQNSACFVVTLKDYSESLHK